MGADQLAAFTEEYGSLMHGAAGSDEACRVAIETMPGLVQSAIDGGIPDSCQPYFLDTVLPNTVCSLLKRPLPDGTAVLVKELLLKVLDLVRQLLPNDNADVARLLGQIFDPQQCVCPWLLWLVAVSVHFFLACLLLRFGCVLMGRIGAQVLLHALRLCTG